MQNIPIDLRDLAHDRNSIAALAAHLVSDVHGGEDLAQESVYRLLRAGQPRPHGRRLAWLRTTVRRLAANEYRGRRSRQHREQEAARPEAVLSSDQIAERAELCQRIHRAIDSLSREQASLLRDHYFGGLAASEIAGRDGISISNVKSRIHRARAALRGALERDGLDGDVHWSIALAPLVPLGASAPAGAGLSSTLNGVAGAGLIMKKIASTALVVLALLVGVQFVLQGAERDAPPAGPEQGAVDAPAIGDDAQLAGAPSQMTARTSIISPANGGATGDGHSPITTPLNARERASLLRVVDPQGVPIPDVRGAWVGQNLDVVALEFDEEGCAERPTETPGRALVLADGHLGRAVVFGQEIEGGPDLDIVLRPWYMLHGVVRIDGVPPGEPILFRRLVSPDQYGGEIEFARIWNQLVALGVPPYALAVPVDPNGSFALTVEWELDLLPLHSRADLRVTSVNGAPPRFGDRWAAADAGVTSIEIDLARLPAVVGRLMWDDGEPASGEHLTLIARTETEKRPSHQYETTDSNGAFTFAAEGTSATLRTVARRLSHDLPLELDLAGAVFPLDLGVIELRRPSRLQVEVVGRRGGVERPVVALVSTGIANGWTDEAGRVVLEFDPARSVEVLAEGYGSHRTDPPLDDSPLRVVLEPGAGLTVIVDSELTGAGLSGRLSVRLAFDRPPFDSAIDVGSPGARSFSTELYMGFQRGHDVSWSFDIGDADASGAINIGSLGSCFAHSRQPFRAPARLRAIQRGCPEEAGSQ